MAAGLWHKLFKMHSNMSSGRDNNATRAYVLFMQRKISPCAMDDVFCCGARLTTTAVEWKTGVVGKLRADPTGNMAHVYPILHLQICLHCSSPGHFHLNGQSLRWWTFWDRRHEWISATHGFLALTEEWQHEGHTWWVSSIYNPHHTAHHLRTLNTALINPLAPVWQPDTIAACVCNTTDVWTSKVLSPPWELAKLTTSISSAVRFDYDKKSSKAMAETQWQIF